MGYETFKEICDRKGVKVSDVVKNTGIAYATISSWKNGTYSPKYEKLQKIAGYLGVSVADIMEPKFLWDSQSDAPAFTIEELQLLDLFRTLPDAKRSEVIQYCKFLASEAKREKKKDTASSKEA